MNRMSNLIFLTVVSATSHPDGTAEPKIERGCLNQTHNSRYARRGLDAVPFAYSLRLKIFRPSQYAPPTRTNAGKPTPAIGPGAPTTAGPHCARAGSTKAAKPTEAKPTIRIIFMILAPHLCPPRQ